MDHVQIDVQIDGNKAVLVLSGRLVRGEHLQLLRENVNSSLREGCQEIVVDLKSVSYVDSAGLGELVAINARARREGTAVLRLVGMSKRLADLSVVSKLRGIFEVELGHVADPLSPRLRDFGWKLWLGVALAILVIIGAMIVLR